MTENKNYIEKISNDSSALARTIGLYLIRKGEQRDETADQNKSGKDAKIYSALIDDFREATLEMTLSVPNADSDRLKDVPLEIKTHPKSPGNSTIANESVDWGLDGSPEQYRVSSGENTVMKYDVKSATENYSNSFTSQVKHDYTRLLQDIILHLTMDVPKREMDAPTEEPTAVQEEPNDVPEKE